jgi:hypothetical protein
LQDVPDLLVTSVRFALRQGWKALTTPRNRESAKAFVRRLFSGAPTKEIAS